MSFAIVLLLLVGARCQTGDYNHGSTCSTVNQTWMTNLGDGIPLKQLTILGTQSSMYLPNWYSTLEIAQTLPLVTQMDAGLRLFDLGCRHYYNGFPIHDGIYYLDVYFSDVMLAMRTWLAKFPGEALVVRVRTEYKDSGNTRTFDDTLASYVANFSDIIWNPTTQDPLLGEVRGKVVLLQAFVSNNTFGLLEADFIVQPHRYHSTNWYLYDKWLLVKAAITAANTSKVPHLTFWTGYGRSFQSFIASGKDHYRNSANRLATGLTTPLFKSYYPDFPRVVCVLWTCSIVFEGLNILGSSYIVDNNITNPGWIFVNFPGDQLLRRMVSLNYLRFTPCNATQLQQGCTVCSPNGSCLICNTALNYAYDNITLSCIAAAGYYLASPPIPCVSAMFGCSLCLSSTVCTECDVSKNYTLDASTNKCIAAPGFYLDPNNISVACNITLRGCTACTSDTVCTQCNPLLSYVLNGTVCQCDSAAYFVDAGTPPVCICESGYYLGVSGECFLYPDCVVPAGGCTSCNSPTCSACDATLFFELDAATSICMCQSGYYFDGSQCLSCGSAMVGCSKCSSATVCLNCTSTFTYAIPDCVCPPATFLDSATSTCLDCVVGCLSCTSLAVCQICDTGSFLYLLANNTCDCISGYYLEVASQTCYPCSFMAGCLTCNTAGCTSCDTALTFTLNATSNLCDCALGNYINSYKKCSVCVMIGCADCTAEDVCRQCSPGYALNGAICDEVCGDGMLFVLPCDDGNLLDGDGCSKTCQIEQDYDCVGGSATQKSVCSYNQPIKMQLVSSLKKNLTNSIQLKFTLSPPLSDLNSVNFSEVITSNFSGVKSITFTYDGTGNLQAEIVYNESIELQPVSLTFTPPYSAAFYSTPPTTLNFNVDSTDNQGLYFFPPQIYHLQTILEPVTTGMGYGFLGLTLLAMPLGRVVPVQMIGVAQVAYLGLMCIQNLQPLLIPFRNLFPVNGINSMFGQPTTNSSKLSSRFTAIGLSNSYLQNLNYMLIYIILPLLVGLVLFIISKVRANDKQWGRWWRRAVGEWFFAGLCIMLYYETTCLLLQVGATELYDAGFYAGVAVGVLVLGALIAMLVLYSLKKAKMGEFKELFNESRFAQKYYLYFCLNRILLMALIVLLNALAALSYVMLALPVITIILLCVFRPYLKPYHNIRAVFNQVCTLFILASYSYYRIQIQNTNTVTTVGLYLPLAVLGVLGAVAVVNVALLVKGVCDQRRRYIDSAKEIQLSEETNRSIEMQLMMQIKAKLNLLETPGNKIGQYGRALLNKKPLPFTPNRPEDSFIHEEQIVMTPNMARASVLKAPSQKVTLQMPKTYTKEEYSHIKNKFDDI